MFPATVKPVSMDNHANCWYFVKLAFSVGSSIYHLDHILAALFQTKLMMASCSVKFIRDQNIYIFMYFNICRLNIILLT